MTAPRLHHRLGAGVADVPRRDEGRDLCVPHEITQNLASEMGRFVRKREGAGASVIMDMNLAFPWNPGYLSSRLLKNYVAG